MGFELGDYEDPEEYRQEFPIPPPSGENPPPAPPKSSRSLQSYTLSPWKLRDIFTPRVAAISLAGAMVACTMGGILYSVYSEAQKGGDAHDTQLDRVGLDAQAMPVKKEKIPSPNHE